MELYLHSPNTPSWRGPQFKEKHRDNFTLEYTGTQIEESNVVRKCIMHGEIKIRVQDISLKISKKNVGNF
jgi:hypothetical protein